MAYESPQSTVAVEVRSNYGLLRDLASAPDALVNDPILLEAAGKAIPNVRNQAVKTIENCGTTPVYWKIGGLPSAGSFHGVLKACTANDDGTGGFVDLSRVPGDIWIAPTTGSTCRVVCMYARSIEGVDLT